MRKSIIAGALLLAAPAYAQQAILQSGPAEIGAPLKYYGPRQAGVAGGLTGTADGLGLKPHSITDDNGLGLCSNSANTLGPYSALCLGHDADGHGILSFDQQGVTGKQLRVRIDGVDTPIVSGIGMAADASNAALPAALAGLGLGHLFPVENYRQAGDPADDDTAVVQRACDAAMAVNGIVTFDNRVYNVGTIHVAHATARRACNFRGASWDGDIGQPSLGGTTLRLLPNTNASMFVVAPNAPVVTFTDLSLHGNRSQNPACAGNTALIEYPSAPAGPKQRSGVHYNIRIEQACRYGVFAGLQRNAGIMDHVAIVNGAGAGFVLGSNSDWRSINSDYMGGDYAFRCTGCGAFTSTASNYFSSEVGIRIDGAAQDVAFFGGSVDKNTRNGIETVGAVGGHKTRAFTGMRFIQNGTSADATYADIRATNDPHLLVIGGQFQKGSAESTGGNYPRFLLELVGTSEAIWVANLYETGADAPFTQADVNNRARALLSDRRAWQNFRIQIDPAATARVRAVGASTPGQGVTIGAEMVDGTTETQIPINLRPADGGVAGRVVIDTDSPRLEWFDRGGVANNRRWYIDQQGNRIRGRLLNDAGDTGASLFEFQRSLTTPQFACWGGDVGATCPLEVRQATGHIALKGGSAPSVATCGSSPSVVGTDSKGIVTIGGGTVTACQVNFAAAWTAAPSCLVSGIGTGSAVVSQSAEPTTGALTIAASADIGGQKVSYTCWQ